MYLIKLVRDRMPEFGIPRRTKYQPVTRAEHVRLLRAKLIEEAAEYATAESTDEREREAADVLDVLVALAVIDLELHPDADIAFERLEEISEGKIAERGGFLAGVGMYAVRDDG